MLCVCNGPAPAGLAGNGRVVQLPVYVINLDRRPDRMADIRENLDRIGVTAERISAVDAELLAKQEDWESRTNLNGSAWNLDACAMACAIGHQKALGAFLATDSPAALILEDDVELAADTASVLRSTDWWPGPATIVRLEHGGIRRSGEPRRIPLAGVAGHTPDGREVRRLERWAGGTAAYLVDRRGAGIVLDALRDPAQPMDHLLFDRRHSRLARRLGAFQVVPAMARQRHGAGDSDLSPHNRGAAPPVRLRLRGLPYRMRYCSLRMLGRVRRIPVAYRESSLPGTPRIAMALPGFADGGTERTVLTVTRGLIARGYRVDLVIFEPSVDHYAGEVPAEARVFALREGPPDESWTSAEWRPGRWSPLLGMKLAARLIREFGEPRVVLNGRPLVRALRLHGWVRRERPDILFAHAPSVELASLYATRIAGAFPPVVPVAHGAVRPRQTRRRKLFFPSAAHVVAVSQGVADSIADATGMPGDRLSVIYNPTDMSTIRRRAKEAPDHPWFGGGGPPVVLSAARLAPEKDFLTLIEAFGRVAAERPCRLVVLGEGPERAGLEARARALGLEDRISLPGRVENPFAFMARARLFVLSSLHEGLGNVLVEAMVCGCPAVATDCPGGVAEVIQDPALLAPVGDPEALARVMLRALDRPVDRAELEAKTARFAMERAMDGYEAVIERALRERVTSRGPEWRRRP